MIRRLRPILASAAVCLLSLPVSAATTTTWQTSGFSAFLKGRLSALSLAADGTLEPGPAPLFQAELHQPAVWSIAQAPDGSIYAATGHEGKLFRVSPTGKISTVWTAQAPEIFAVTVAHDGTVYAATSPNGGIYRIRQGAEALEIWHCPAKYIWAIQAAPDGALFVATGQPGRIYRITASGAASLYYDTGQENVTALQLAPDGRLYAGTDPNGLFYRIMAPRQATVLLDSDLPEIRAIALAPDGAIYVAGTGGAVATRSSPNRTGSVFSAGAVGVSPTVITVTAASKNAAATTGTSAQAAAALAAAAQGQGGTVTEVSGAERSAIYRIESNRTVETLQTSKQYNIYDMLLEKGSVIFSTDDHGRIYSLAGDGRISLLSEPGQGETTRLLMHGSTLYAALSNPARLIALGPSASTPGKYESEVHDCSSVAARWGHVHWHGQGSGVVFYTRTGNSARPDGTWSGWSRLAGDLIQSPPGRFVQWRAEVSAKAGIRIDSVGIPYLPQNAPPVIRSVTVSSVLGASAAKTDAAASSSNSAYTITVTDTGDAPAAGSASSTTDTVTHLESTQTQIAWQADDPDHDKLVYAVYFRAEGEKKWQLIRNRMFANTLRLDPDVFADGRYFFRLAASDSPSNAAQYARQTELVSAPVLIDNTPPSVTIAPPRRSGSSFEIDVTAHDKTSPLRLCQYSLDTGLWQPIEAADGITDSRTEHFHLRLDHLKGEHLVVFRVYDSANNAGLAKVILR
jgi:sugar lactone lactonase YvrE